jgi:hypothetical protein
MTGSCEGKVSDVLKTKAKDDIEACDQVPAF